MAMIRGGDSMLSDFLEALIILLKIIFCLCIAILVTLILVWMET